MNKRQIVVLEVTTTSTYADPAAWDWAELVDDDVQVLAAGRVEWIGEWTDDE